MKLVEILVGILQLQAIGLVFGLNSDKHTLTGLDWKAKYLFPKTSQKQKVSARRKLLRNHGSIKMPLNYSKKGINLAVLQREKYFKTRGSQRHIKSGYGKSVKLKSTRKDIPARLDNKKTSVLLAKQTSLRSEVSQNTCDEQFTDYCPVWNRCYDSDGCHDEIIPCRDCTGTGQVCENKTACYDPLSYCGGQYGVLFYSETDRNDLPGEHPCRSDACNSYTGSSACLSEIYQFCCDPSLEDCNPSPNFTQAKNQYPCSGYGCSRFIEDGKLEYEDNKVDYSNVACPFLNESLCDMPCEPFFFQIFESFGNGRCEGSTCLKHEVERYVLPHTHEYSVYYEYYDSNSAYVSQVKHNDTTRNTSFVDPSDLPSNIPSGLVCYQNPFLDNEDIESNVCPVHPAIYIAWLFQNHGKNGVTVNECLLQEIDLSNGDLSCSGLLKCMNYIFYLFSEVGNADLNLLCFGEFIACSEFRPELEAYGVSNEQHILYQGIYQKYMVCSGETEEDGHDLDQTWDYNAPCNDTKPGCNSQCCSLMLNLANGNPAFEQSPDLYHCGQLKTSASVKSCLQQHCQRCYSPNGGPFGPDHSVQQKILKNQCVSNIYNHCQTTGDPACENDCPLKNCREESAGTCPCKTNACVEFYDLDFSSRAACTRFRDQLLKEYVTNGYLQPDSEWLIQELSLRNAYLSPHLNSSKFSASDKLRNMADLVGCEFTDLTLECFTESAEFCNSGTNFYSQQCTKLSVCGDGVLSWGEVCDDGNMNDYEDGCRDCTLVEENYVCSRPGKPCELCDYDKSSTYDHTVCPFCRNEKISGLQSPCYYNDCIDLNDYTKATSCDEYVEFYCMSVSNKSLYDPGCTRFVSNAPKFAIPEVLDSCTYDISKVNLNFDTVKGVKFAIIECELIDKFEAFTDTTPLVPYFSLKHELSQSEYDDLPTEMQILLDVNTKYNIEELIPLTGLTDHELDFLSDHNLRGEKGPLAMENNYKRIAKIRFEENRKQESFEDCSNPFGFDLMLLSPCTDPVQQFMRLFLKRGKFRYFAYNDYDFEDFGELDYDYFDNFHCDAKPGVVQFAISLGIYRMEWRGDRDQKTEYAERICIGEEDSRWEECPTIEELLSTRKGTLSFGNLLYSPDCLDTECELKSEKCSQIKIVPGKPSVNLTAFDENSKKLHSEIASLTELDSWSQINSKLAVIDSLAQSKDLSASFKLFSSFIQTGQVPKYLKGVENFCPYEYWKFNATSSEWQVSEEWKSDPCCNWELLEYLCCAPKDLPNGFITVVTGFKDEKIDTFCATPNQIKALAQDLKHKLDQAQSLQRKISDWTDLDKFNRIWEFEENCRSRIESSDSCNIDADCFCSYSFCTADWSGQNKCRVNENDRYKCFAQCFYEEYSVANPALLSNIKSYWGIDPLEFNLKEFEIKWGEHMTESGCAGPESWKADIGQSRYEWVCDDICEAKATCSINHGTKAAALALGVERKLVESLHWNMEICESLGFQVECIYESSGTCYKSICLVPGLYNYSMPCYDQRQCYDTCSASCNRQENCEARNGTWMKSTQACCPSEGFVHLREAYWDKDIEYEECKYFPQGTPNGYEYEEETCCLAHGGNWRSETGTSGTCCFGIFQESCNKDGCQFWCEENIDVWAECNECYQSCDQMGTECRECYKERESCCESTFIPQDKEACLNYTACNDRSIVEDSLCQDFDANNTGWCGDNGWPRSEESACEIYPANSNCQELGGYVFNNRCFKDFGVYDSVENCLPDICPMLSWSTLYPSYQNPEHGYFGSLSCEPGCYLKLNSSSFELREQHWGTDSYCVKSYVDITGRLRHLFGHYYPELETCRIYWSEKEVCESAGVNGTYVVAYYRYDYPRYFNEEQCNAGYCEGSINRGNRDKISNRWLGNQPWSREQCLSYSSSSCSRWCPYCESANWEIKENGGGCFNTSTYSLLESSKIECNINDTQWYECPQPITRSLGWEELNQFCVNNKLHSASNYSDINQLGNYKRTSDSILPVEVLSALSCQAHFDRCRTDTDCKSIGDCRGTRYGWVEFRTHVCHRPNWEHGDQLWGIKIQKSINENGVASFFSEQENCEFEYQEEIEGICISPRINGRCPEFKWHTLGCKTDGYHDKITCEDAKFTWFDAPYNEESCVAVKGCLLDFHIRQLQKEECEKCDGTAEPYMRWDGGKLEQPYVRDYFWHQSREMSSINDWILTQASWKIEPELSFPLLKTFAQLKKMELSVQYNLYRNVLRAFACDCSGRAVSDGKCFSSVKMAADTGEINAYIGCALQEEFGPGSLIQVSGKCVEDSNNQTKRRFLQTNMTETNNTRANAIISTPTDVSFSYISAAGNTVMEPCQNESASLIDTVVLEVDFVNDIFVGQLIGDGIGLASNSTFGQVAFCLEGRNDIKLYDHFTQIVVARRENNRFIMQSNETVQISSASLSKLCLTVSEPGEYFPAIASSTYNELISNIIDIKPINCSGLAVLGTYDRLHCLCPCGFYGVTCSFGCPDYCSFNGLCDEYNNTCSCLRSKQNIDLFVGKKCDRLNCPINKDSLTICSGKGTCLLNDYSEDVYCSCQSGYNGYACQSFVAKNETSNSGYSPSETAFEGPDFSVFERDSQSPSISPTTNSSLAVSVKPTHNSTKFPTAIPTNTFLKPTLMPSKNPIQIEFTKIPSFQPTNLPTSAPTIQIEFTKIPSFQPTNLPTSAPTRTFVEPEPIATLTVSVSVANNETKNLMDVLASKMAETFGLTKDKNNTGHQRNNGDLRVEVELSITETTSMVMKTEPSQEVKDILLEATRKVRCGNKKTVVCSVTEHIDSRILIYFKKQQYSLNILVQDTLSTNDILENVTSNTFSLTDAGFQDALSTAITETSAQQNVSGLQNNYTVSEPVTETAAKVSIVYVPSVDGQATSPIDLISSIQENALNTSKVGESLATIAVKGVSFGAAVVDLCEGRTCSGHGICSEGSCTCDTGYTGASCEFATPLPTTSPTTAPSDSPSNNPTVYPTSFPTEREISGAFVTRSYLVTLVTSLMILLCYLI